VKSRPGFLSRLVNVRILAAVREERDVDESPARVPDHTESLDAIAGSEFVDDRLRLRE
jgi:hypothetical protein